MAQTLVSLYDDRTTAQAVLSDLEDAGFGTDHIRFTSNEKGARTSYDLDDSQKTPDVLTHYGVSDDEARFYTEGVRRGGSLVISRVHDSDVDKARDIMARHNPARYEDRQETYLAEYQEDAPAYSEKEMVQNREAFADQSKQRLQEIEEHIKIGKREVVRGGVRVHKYVETDVEEETLRLREEHVDVERTAVNQKLTPEQADAAFKEETVEMVERAEEAVMSKEAVVTGEVAVGKDVDVREETVGGEVRRTRVEVERIAGEQLTAARPAFQEHYKSAYASTGRSYDDYEPAYTYGYAAGQTYSDRDYAAVESDLRTDYSARYNNGDDSAWDDFKDAVRHGYNKARAAV